MGWPAVLQEPVEEPVDAVPEAEAGAGAEPATEGAAAATEGEVATEGAAAAAATEGEEATAGPADIEGAAAGAAAPEAPELLAFEAWVPEDPLDELPDAPHFGPVGGVKTSALLALAISTEDPALGNLTSLPSAVVQSVAGIFAINISGNEVPRSESS